MARAGKMDYLKLAGKGFDRLELKLRTKDARRFDIIVLAVGRIVLDGKSLVMHDCTIYSGMNTQAGYKLRFTKEKNGDCVRLYYNRRLLRGKCTVVDVLADADSSINLF